MGCTSFSLALLIYRRGCCRFGKVVKCRAVIADPCSILDRAIYRIEFAVASATSNTSFFANPFR